VVFKEGVFFKLWAAEKLVLYFNVHISLIRL
jgi:hypothetical protein